MSQQSTAPAGLHNVTPYLVVEDARALIVFVKDVFGAETKMEPVLAEDGKIMHAQMQVGDSVIMLSDVCQSGSKPIPAMLYVYVANPDAVFDRAIKVGATAAHPVQDQFYGDRSGAFVDKLGNTWWVAARISEKGNQK